MFIKISICNPKDSINLSCKSMVLKWHLFPNIIWQLPFKSNRCCLVFQGNYFSSEIGNSWDMSDCVFCMATPTMTIKVMDNYNSPFPEAFIRFYINGIVGVYVNRWNESTTKAMLNPEIVFQYSWKWLTLQCNDWNWYMLWK